MTDTAELRAIIEHKGLKYKYVAEKLGLSAYGLQKKLDNKTEFKVSEVYKLSELLSLSPQQMARIFFTNDVDSKSTSRKSEVMA